MKQSVEPQSIRVIIVLFESDKRVEKRGIRREFGSERADTLIRNISCAQCWVTQPSACAEVGELLVIFLSLQFCQFWWLQWPCQLKRWTWYNSLPYVRHHHRTCIGCCRNGIVFPGELIYHLCLTSVVYTPPPIPEILVGFRVDSGIRGEFQL